MLKFRETLWFKKGELDAREAALAADGDDDLAPGAVDLLPVQDRYQDDGSLTRTDSHSFGVHSGTTTYLREIGTAGSVGEAAYAEKDLVGEMKRGTALRLMLIGGGLLGVAVLVATFS
jgi:hypothetical protein